MGLRAWGLCGTRWACVPSREGRRERPAQALCALPWCESQMVSLTTDFLIKLFPHASSGRGPLWS